MALVRLTYRTLNLNAMQQKHLTLLLLFFTLFVSAYGPMHDSAPVQETSEGNPQKGVFWKIEKRGMTGPAYLFGTYHLLNDGYLNNWPSVKKAYQESDKVVVEMVVDSSQIGEAMMVGMMSDRTLSDLLDSADFTLVDEEVQRTMGISLTQLNQMKPIMVAAALTLTYNQQAYPELSEINGVPMDLFFAYDGEKQGKEVIGFETLMEQSRLLYESNTVEEQAQDLLAMVSEREDALKLTDDIIEAYKGNDFEMLERLGQEDFDHWGSIDHLLDERNEHWLEELPTILGEGKVFIAVGALHLTGRKGLVKELRALGYTVEPVDLK